MKLRLGYFSLAKLKLSKLQSIELLTKPGREYFLCRCVVMAWAGKGGAISLPNATLRLNGGRNLNAVTLIRIVTRWK